MRPSNLFTFKLSERQFKAVLDAIELRLERGARDLLTPAHRNTLKTAHTAMSFQKESPGVRR